MVQLDPNIVLQAGRYQAPDPAQTLAQVANLKAAAGQARAQDMQLAQLTRQNAAADAKSAALRGAVGADGNIDYGRVKSAMVEAGDVEGAMGIDSTQGKQRVQQIELAQKQTERGLQLLGGVFDQSSLERVRAQAAQEGLPVEGIPTVYDPATLEKLYTAGLSVKDKLNMAFEREKFGYQQQNDATGRAVTMRGQDMADARARATAGAGGAGFGNAPSGYRFKGDGSLEPIPGGPAGGGKALTEDQGKSTGNYRVMRQAAETLNGVKGYNPSVIASALDKGDLTGTSLSQVDRRALNAQRAFVVAALRSESGATYGPSEVIDKVRTLFPVPGDGAEVLADKALLRRQFLGAARDRAGVGVKDIPRLGAPAAATGAGGWGKATVIGGN